MGWLPRFRRRREDEIAEEIQTHLEMAMRERVERGESPEAARQAALREFGNVGLIRRATREVWSWTWVEQLLQDLRFGARILWHSPGVSATAVVLVALVIGGNTTIYSIVHNILTTPASGVEAERLVFVGQVSPDSDRFGPYMSYPNYLDYAAQSRTVRQLSGWSNERLTLGTDSGSYAVYGALVTAAYFDTLGVRMSAGRTLGPGDDSLGAGLVAVISDRIWTDRFSRAPDVVGRPITVNGNAATVIGVASPRFRGAALTPGEDVWLPITAYYDAIGSQAVLRNRAQWTVHLVGELPAGISLAQAQAEFRAIAAQLEAAYPEDNKDRRTVVSKYSATAMLPVARLAPRFLALFSVITVLTLLIVSANVANLMLARAVVRQRETAVRQSLGASRARIIRMLAAEGLAVSLTAWMAACLSAWWTSRALVGFLEPAQRGLMPDFEPDWVVAAYAMALAMLSTIAFTTAPALRTWRQQVLPWLKAGEQAVAPGRSRLSSVLVVLQLGFSVLLLTSAGLAYRSISLLDSGEVGFAKQDLLLVTVRAGRRGAMIDEEPMPAEREAGFALLERVRTRLLGVGHIQSASYSRRAPGAYLLATVPVWRHGQAEPTQAFRRPVGPDYLNALGLTPVAGRGLTVLDSRGAPRTAVISQRLATRLWPGESALGHTLLVGEPREEAEIVGIAPDALYDGPSHDPHPHFVFLAEQQSAGAVSTDPIFYIRYRGSLDVVAPLVGKAIAEVDATLPIVAMATMESRLAGVTELERLVATLLIFFATASLVIATLGQYAISSFNMRRRTRDFGVRMALGASSVQIQHAVIREALRLTLIGLLLGFALSVAAGAAFRRALFGITPTDPPTYLAVFVLLAGASVVASYVPAWRAGKVNVMEALRQE